MYALTRQDVHASKVVVSSITIVCSRKTHELFISRSTHSQVSSIFAKHCFDTLDKLNDPFMVTTPMGEFLLVEYVYHACEISIFGRESLMDLMVL